MMEKLVLITTRISREGSSDGTAYQEEAVCSRFCAPSSWSCNQNNRRCIFSPPTLLELDVYFRNLHKVLRRVGFLSDEERDAPAAHFHQTPAAPHPDKIPSSIPL
jgi:hypothetical protein